MARAVDTRTGLACRQVLAVVAAVPCALLPRRLWESIEPWLPIHHLALPSALLTCALAVGIGVPGFAEYASVVADRNVAALLEVAARPQAGPEASTAGPVSLGMFSLFFFLLLTPKGWLTSYLALSGLLRCLSVAVAEAMGDPLLTLADSLLRWQRQNRRAKNEERERERAEGIEVPDVLLTGSAAGLSCCSLVVVASRRKPGWTRGAFVVTAQRRFRIGDPLDCRTPNGLRRLYPLTEATDLEVMRRWVRYELPPLTSDTVVCETMRVALAGDGPQAGHGHGKPRGIGALSPR